MQYATYSYYELKYLLGRNPAVPEDAFLYWEKQARTEIDKYTFDQIAMDSSFITDQIRDCCCELVELLYQADQMQQQSTAHGDIGPLVTFNNDGQSGTYDLSRSVYTEDGKVKKVREIISRYLGNTGLLYCGI